MTGQGGDWGAACLNAGDIVDDLGFRIFGLRPDQVDGKVLGLTSVSSRPLVLVGFAVGSNNWSSFSLTSLADFLHVSELVEVSTLDSLGGAPVGARLPERGLSFLGPKGVDGLDLFLVQVLGFGSVGVGESL